MNADTHILMYLRSTNWIRSEMRKATKLPAKKMMPRIEELLNRSKALGREVNKFLEQKDAQ